MRKELQKRMKEVEELIFKLGVAQKESLRAAELAQEAGNRHLVSKMDYDEAREALHEKLAEIVKDETLFI